MSQDALTTKELRQIVEDLLANLGAYLESQNHKMIEWLIEENHVQSGNNPNTLIGFLFGGTFYTTYRPKDVRHLPKMQLHDSLYDEGKKLHEAIRDFEHDHQRLRQGLYVLIRDCKTWQDVRDALPDILRSYIAEISNLPRTRPEGYTVADKPFQADQYQTTVDLVTHHLSARMLG